MKHALIILAKEGFQDHEYAPTRKELEAGGFEVTIASTEKGSCTGKYGSTEEATVTLKEVDVTDFDAIVFIGGPGAFELIDNPDALKIANDAARQNIVLGAICIAPAILAKARVLEAKKATISNKNDDQSHYLTDFGAIYTGDTVTVDDTIVTADGPDSAEQFGRTLASM